MRLVFIFVAYIWVRSWSTHLAFVNSAVGKNSSSVGPKRRRELEAPAVGLADEKQ